MLTSWQGNNYEKIDRDILLYLSEKNWAGESSVINETYRDFNVSKEEYINNLKVLQKKDFIRYERPFGQSGAFVSITEEGRRALVVWYKRMTRYVLEHILEILTLIVTVISLMLAILH